MALRDKLRDRAQPYLEPGEQIQAVFLCQTGPSPWFAALSWLIILFGAKYYVVVATDRSLVVLNASGWVPSKPKGLDRRMPRSTRIGPLSGLWGKSEFLGQKTHIHKRFHGDVATADAAATGAVQGYGVIAGPAQGAPAIPATGAAARWYPDPQNPAVQRYWDGSTWTEHTAP